MLKYNVRSRQIVDLVNEIKDEKLITSPFFQRNLVWRLMHKQDFIKTILLGFPFPEIFIAKGDLDVEDMTSTSCIVDGQQRMTAIVEFINNKFEVEGRSYKDLEPVEKENFLKYEVAIVDLDMKATDPNIKDLFSRLNRTFYSLTTIEKMATEYASSEFMLVAKLLSTEIDFEEHHTDDEQPLKHDPNITEEFIEWSKKKSFSNFNGLIMESSIFSKYEVSRKVHLMFVLNVIATIIKGIYNRNLKKELLDEYEENFEQKDEVVEKLDAIAEKILSLEFGETSYWLNKANAFSLIVVFYENWPRLKTIDSREIKTVLEEFTLHVPGDYALAAKEGVNNKRERLLRHSYIQRMIDGLVD
jgi:hypothetical protein